HDEAGVAAFLAHADWFQAIHPDWYALADDGAGVRPLAGADDPRVRAAAERHHVLLMPMVAGGEEAERLRRMLSSPGRRAAHVRPLVETAAARGYAGLDIDYEHLWSAADRVPYRAFLAELAKAMHAAGKQLSVAVPGLAQAGRDSAWDYAELAATVDAVHLL